MTMAIDANNNNIIYVNINSPHTINTYKNYIIMRNDKVCPGYIAFSAQQRKDNKLQLHQEIEID